VKQDRKDELDCIEKEIEVSDGNVLQEIFLMLGYSKTVEVKKKRVKTKFKDYEICLDEVDGLGSFIEVEKITSEDGEAVQTELFKFLQSLGVKLEDRVRVGYDSLMWQKDHL
jgi:adenylate cyclase class 2